MKRILITQLGFIGDVILSTPIIRALRDKFPESELTVLTTVAAAPLVELHPARVSVITYDKRGKESGVKGFLKLRAELKSRQFDAVFSLHKSARTALLHRLSGIPLRYGFKESALAFLYSKTISRNSYSHDVERNLSILKTIDLDVEAPRLEIGFSSEVANRVEPLIPKQKFVVIAPGSVWKTKRWRVQGFAEVASKLLDKGLEVVLIGAKDEQILGELISKRCSRELKNYIGKLTLIESAAILSRASIVVSNDSSPLHLASCFGIPTVALFCATVPEFGFGPYGQPNRVLGVENLACRPCGRHGKSFCPTGTHACQVGITAEEVLLAVNELLAESLG